MNWSTRHAAQVPRAGPGTGRTASARSLSTRGPARRSWPRPCPAASSVTRDVGFVASPTTGGFVPQGRRRRTADRLAHRRIRTGRRQPLRRRARPLARWPANPPMAPPTAEPGTSGEGHAAGYAGREDRRRRLADGQNARTRLGIAPTHGQRHRHRPAHANRLPARSPDHPARPR